ncbi:hypothetical protein FKP32DRAFT_363959 [Trametes sanguinea]|nr:hypothetical protein FKP32DRAFT_363959 [Trametes sanguinea]
MHPTDARSATSGHGIFLFQQVFSVFWVPWVMGQMGPRNGSSCCSIVDRVAGFVPRPLILISPFSLACRPPTIHHLPISNLPLQVPLLLPSPPFLFRISGAPTFCPSRLI